MRLTALETDHSLQPTAQSQPQIGSRHPTRFAGRLPPELICKHNSPQYSSSAVQKLNYIMPTEKLLVGNIQILVWREPQNTTKSNTLHSNRYAQCPVLQLVTAIYFDPAHYIMYRNGGDHSCLLNEDSTYVIKQVFKGQIQQI